MSNFLNFATARLNEKFAAEVDEVELRALELGEAPFETAHLDENATGQFIEDQSALESQAHLPIPALESTEESIQRKLKDNIADIGRSDLRREDSIAGMRAEIERRITIMKDSYPFLVQRGSLRLKEQSDIPKSTYITLLKLSDSPSSQDRDSFERVVGEALKSYLGSTRSEVVCFGWRAKTEDERPRRFKQMIAELFAKSGEWNWDPRTGFPADPAPRTVKDMGLDVIAWIPMPDGREGQIFVVAQCATGVTNWETKFDDVNWDRLGNWIRPVPAGWSVRCFAVPFHVPNSAKWVEVSSRGGLFLDRARITLLLQE